MALSRRIARPLLASIFVVGGWDALWNPEGKAKKAEAVSQPLSESVGVDQLDPKTLVRFNGAVQVGGRGRSWPSGSTGGSAALALIGSISPDDLCRASVLAGVGSNHASPTEDALPEEPRPPRRSHSRRLRHRRTTISGLASKTPSSGVRDDHRRGTGEGSPRSQERSRPRAFPASKAGKRTIRQGRAIRRRAGERLKAGLDLAHEVAPDPEDVAARPRRSRRRSTGFEWIARPMRSSTQLQSSPTLYVSWSPLPAMRLTQDSMRSRRTLLRERNALRRLLSKVREHLPVD